jgi:multidrug resistance efflux pump
VVGLLMVGAAVLLNTGGTSHSGSTAAVNFDTQPSQFGILHQTVTGTAIVQPQDALTVSTQSTGQVTGVFHDFNEVVPEGELLLQLDDRKAQTDLARAKAATQTAAAGIDAARASVTKATGQRDAAQATYDDMKSASKGAYTPNQLRAAELAVNAAKAAVEEAEAGVKAAQAKLAEAEEAVRQAELGVELTRIRVPVVDRSKLPGGRRERARDLGEVAHGEPDGEPKRKYLILDRKVSLNQLVGPPLSSQLFTLAPDLEQMDLQVQITESDVSKVSPGKKVYFTVSASGDTEATFTGQVVETRLLPTSVQGAVFYTAVVSAKNQRVGKDDWRLRPGMTTTGMDIIYNSEKGPDGKGVWMIPNAALDFQLDEHYYPPGLKEKPAPTRGDNEKLIWVLDGNNQPQPTYVKVGETGKMEEEKAGLKPESYTQVEWDPGLKPQPVPGNLTTYPRVITGAPPAKKSSWLPSFTNVIKF